MQSRPLRNLGTQCSMVTLKVPPLVAPKFGSSQSILRWGRQASKLSDRPSARQAQQASNASLLTLGNSVLRPNASTFAEASPKPKPFTGKVLPKRHILHRGLSTQLLTARRRRCAKRKATKPRVYVGVLEYPGSLATLPRRRLSLVTEEPARDRDDAAINSSFTKRVLSKYLEEIGNA